MRLAESPSGADPDQRIQDFPLQRPLLVAGGLDGGWLWVGFIFTIVLTALAVLSLATNLHLAARLAVAALLCGTVSGVALLRLWNRRCWLTIEPAGFQLNGRHGDHEFSDGDVRGLAFRHQWQHSFGRLVAEVHGVKVWIGDEEHAPLEWRVRSAIGEASPLAPLILRLKSRLLEQADENLRRSIAVSGEGWSWTADGVVSGRGSQQATLPAKDITAVDQNHQELRIWRNSEPLPAIRLPLAHRDVWLLAALLQPLYGRPGDPGVPPASGMGRVLREHRPRSAMIASALLGLFAAAVAGVCFAAALWLRMLPLALVGGGVGVTAIALASTTLRLSKSSFRLHETGVSQTTLSGDRFLPFSEIDQFAFDGRRQYSRGRYLGMVFTLVFVSQRRPRDGIFHTERAPFETEEILQMRDLVAEESARRMTHRWLTEGSVAWTPELTILQQSLRYERRRGLLGRAQPLDLPLSEIGAFDVVDGWFLVWGIEHDTPLIRVRTSSPNFYPGLLLFEQIDANLSVT